MNEKLDGPLPGQEWEQHPEDEDVWALVQESIVALLPTIQDKDGLDHEANAKLRQAVHFVKDNLKEIIEKRKPTVAYLNQIGGAKTYVASLILDRLAATVSSVKQFNDIYNAHVIHLFWHTPGTDSYKRIIERRLAN